MQESKILITNYPRPYQCPSFEMVGDASKTIDIVCGYDIKLDKRQVVLNIARDLIMALLTFDRIYIEGMQICDIIQVFGSENLKKLLRLHILRIIPDQELVPVMMREDGGEWRHDFFAYAIGSDEDMTSDNIHKWSHIEEGFRRRNFQGADANAILYLVDENSVEINNIKEIQEKVNHETEMDSHSPIFLSDPNFYRRRPDGKWEYNMVSRVRLQELNKSAILTEMLGIDNVKMDAEISNLLSKKTASLLSKTLHTGTDSLARVGQQKGFPDLGELFVNGLVSLDEILKLRECFNGRLFRYWAKTTEYEEKLMCQDIMNSTQNILGSKCMQPIRMLACNVVGLAGFLPGLAASAFDSYILDKVSKGWHPNFFLDDKLKKLIDGSVEEYNKQKKVALLQQRFKDVGRNDPCPCGSGKKFKKCHGKDL